MPIDDTTALSDAISRISSNDALRSNLITNGRAAYESEFTRHAVTARMADLYRELMDTPSSQANTA